MCFFTPTGKLVRCVKSTNQVYWGIFYWKVFYRSCFFKTFSDSEQRNLEFYQKSTSVVVTTTIYGSGGTLRSNILKQVLKHINFFWIISGVSKTTSKNYFQGWQNRKKCLEEEPKENFIPREKNLLFYIFQNFARSLFTISEKLQHGCQNRNLSTFRKFWGKLIFFKWNMFANIFGFRDVKNRAFSQKIFFRVFTTGIRASRGMFWGKKISLSKKFFFSVIFFGVWVILLSFLQNSLVRCVKPPTNVRRELK